MGAKWSNNETKPNIIILGLDSVGKTTILYQLKLNEVIRTTPTLGFNLETIIHHHRQVGLTDVGKMVHLHDKEHLLRSHFYRNASGILYVVDSVDRNRLPEASSMLSSVTGQSALDGVPVLVMANKQDVRAAMTPNEIADELLLWKLLQGRKWTILPACSFRRQDIETCLDWLLDSMSET